MSGLFGVNQAEEALAVATDVVGRSNDGGALSNDLVSATASPKLNAGCVEMLTTLNRLPGPGLKNNSFPSGDHTRWWPSSSFLEI